MPSQRQVVDYALQRRALLAQVRAGKVGTAEVCDAGPYLLRAARFHGEPTDTDCPLCHRDRLAQVSWIFGDTLRQSAGSARRPAELALLAEHHPDFSVYVVEVCPTCHWNHLVISYVTGTGHGGGAPGTPGPAGRRTERRRSVAE